ncbi:MAG: C40 family peptidase [Phenylobacterium sp.]|nr:C40 family peptidase [Phenylobacterium sp.]MCA6251702.1 C40 family peptidase [Phenylobacterium sp.]MCA6269917.1 C40 family peptidase [Phenylobacterium sp.]MCA6279325.1 C40 family peptidase [Phenylobacterium sp.]MCA6290913.1 C40 family peptidase [Phenylobacterium sp.]
MQVAVPAASIRRAPRPDAEQLDQILLGERFDVLETRDGFAWGQAVRDGYVGHVAFGALAPEGPPPTHWVRVPLTYGFEAPSIKSRPTGPISLNSLVTVTAREGPLALCDAGFWVPESHLAPLGDVADDPAAIAEAHLGAAYLWGGREGCGIDCSGLVLQSLLACGRACPRDSDLQQALGAPVAAADLDRGDLVFWKGHVAILLDGARIIHANAHHMAVAKEPLREAVQRIRKSGGGEPTAYRRPLARTRPEAA